MTKQYDVLLAALNELIEINYSRIDGYKKASEEMNHGELKSLFETMIHESEGFAESLVEHVKKFDGEPATSGSLLGKVHQAWLDFKASIASNNKATILSSCEFGDSAAIKAYDTALAVDKVNASPKLVDLLNTQKSIIEDSLKLIRSMMHTHQDVEAEKETLENIAF